MLKSYSIIYLVLLANISVLVFSSKLNEKCQLRSGQEGICTQYVDCSIAHEQYSKGIFPTLCSGLQYVCCETINSAVPTTEATQIYENSATAKSDRLMSKVLESTNCFSGKLMQTADNENADGFVYATNEDHDLKNTNGINNFMAKIGVRNTNGDVHYFCGGVLLTFSFVLFPAHCSNYKGQIPEIVLLGIENSNNENLMEKIPISKIHVHPDYDREVMYNDLALLELAISTTFLPACIWRWNESNISSNTTIFSIGHDLINIGQMQYMHVEVKTPDHCNKLYEHVRILPEGLNDAQYCIANSNITDASACKGFIGSPLFAQNGNDEIFVIGLANYVQQCYSTIYPIIFTKLSAYTDWLEDIIY